MEKICVLFLKKVKKTLAILQRVCYDIRAIEETPGEYALYMIRKR